MIVRNPTQLIASVSLAGFALASTGCSVHAKFEAKTAKDADEQEATPAPAEGAEGEAEAEAEAEAPKANVTVKGSELVVDGAVAFTGDSITLTPDSEPTLQEILAYLGQNERVTKMRIEGHTHNKREEPVSLSLSGQRAVVVRKWLVSKGIAEERLLSVGFGADVPIANNGDPEGQLKNERISFRIAELDGKPYLGTDPLAGGRKFD